jgi:NAD-dependent deacetylase
MERHFERVWTLTQNVDGFHRAAGTQNLIEIHGDLHDILCTDCGWRQHVGDYDAIEFPPTCPQCRRIVRPDVVLFGELLPPAKVQQLFAQCRRGAQRQSDIDPRGNRTFPWIDFDRRSPPHSRLPHGFRDIRKDAAGADAEYRVEAAPALDAIWTRYCQRRGVNLP